MTYRVTLDFRKEDFNEFLTLLKDNREGAYSYLVESVFNLVGSLDYPVCVVSYSLCGVCNIKLTGDYDVDADLAMELEELVDQFANIRDELGRQLGVNPEFGVEALPYRGEGDGDE